MIKMGRFAFIMMTDNRIRFGDYGAVMNFIFAQILEHKIEDNKFMDFAHSDRFVEIEAKVKAAQDWANAEGIELDLLELVPDGVSQDQEQIACAL
jgi:hypothetical protein